MVTETIPEIQTGAPDAEQPVVPPTEPDGAVSTPGGVAPPSEETQSTSETKADESPVFDSAEAYLESLEKQDGKPEEKAPASPVNPELVKAARERFQNTHKENLAFVDELRSLILEGADTVTLGEKLAEGKERLNKFFQSAVNDAGYEAAQQTQAAQMAAIFDGLEQALPKGSVEKLTEAITTAQGEGKTYSWADVASFVKDTAVGEFKQSTEYKSALTGAFNAGRAAGERSQEVAKSGRTPGGISGSGGRTEDDALMDPNTPVSEVQAILARRAAAG